MENIEDHIRNALVPLYPRLKRFAVSLTGSLDRADDLVQHACERALEKTAHWSPATRLDQWLFSIIHDAWMHERRRALRVSNALQDEAAGTKAAGYRLQAEDRLMLDDVFRKFLQLPEEQRTVLTLVCIDGLSYRETADVLNICIGTVMSRVSRGRMALAKLMEERQPRPASILKAG